MYMFHFSDDKLWLSHITAQLEFVLFILKKEILVKNKGNFSIYIDFLQLATISIWFIRPIIIAVN